LTELVTAGVGEMSSGGAAEAVPPAVLALDVGASTIKAAVVDHHGTRVHEARVPTRREHGGQAALRAVQEVALDLLHRPGALVQAAGVAVPGTVGPDGSVTSVNLGWEKVEVVPSLVGRLGVPLTVLNDAQAGALGEGRSGCAVGVANFLYVSLGTGIGGAIVDGGRLFSGAHGQAGEIGHLRVEYPGRTCACGASGCLQTVMSAAALEARWAEVSGAALAADKIVALARSGSSAAAGIWQAAVDGLAAGLLHATTMLDPASIVIGGGLAGAGDTLLAPLRASLESQARPFHVVAPLHLAALGPWSGCAGAASAAWALLGGAGGPP
jgi:glucokinase